MPHPIAGPPQGGCMGCPESPDTARTMYEGALQFLPCQKVDVALVKGTTGAHCNPLTPSITPAAPPN